MQIFEWPIEDVTVAHPGLYLDHHAAMAVVLMGEQVVSPYEFLVECEGFCPLDLDDEPLFLLRVSWNEQTAASAKRIRQTEQGKPILERASVALAALTFAHLIPGGHLRVTEEGERADYWLPRVRRALEVSGTMQAEHLPRRQQNKKVQMLANPRGWDGYVFVCFFGPTRGRVLWSYHAQEE